MKKNINRKINRNARTGKKAALLQAGLVSLLRNRPRDLAPKLAQHHPADIAAALGSLAPKERAALLGSLSPAVLGPILAYAPQYLEGLNPVRRAELLAAMAPEKAADCLRRTDEYTRRLLLGLMPPSVGARIFPDRGYAGETAGSRMSSNFIALQEGMTIREAMKEVVALAPCHDNLSALYVTDTDGRLVGAIDLKDLIVAREGTALSAITAVSCPRVYVHAPVEEWLDGLRPFAGGSVPVVDADDRLAGVLTAAELARLTEEEANGDYARLGGLRTPERAEEPLKKSVAARLPWLLLLLVLGLGVSGVTGMFEGVAAHLPVLICFQALVLDMAGNVGTQSLAFTLGILGDDAPGCRRLLLREGRIALVNGLLLGAGTFCTAGLFLLLRGEAATLALPAALCIAAALLIAVVFSGIAGAAVPMLFYRLGIDPAAASGPLITTVNDLVAVVAYYGLAWLLLLPHAG